MLSPELFRTHQQPLSSPMMNWCNRHFALEIAALALCVLVCLFGQILERIQWLRLGAHVDGLSIVVLLSFLLAILGIALPRREGHSKSVAVILFVLLLVLYAVAPPLLFKVVEAGGRTEKTVAPVTQGGRAAWHKPGLAGTRNLELVGNMKLSTCAQSSFFPVFHGAARPS